ncbi:MAG: response regulator [Thermoanaerobaculia bacterium]
MAKKILLADDSITIQKVVELTFSDGDFEVVAVNNGARAIQQLQESRPDIILSDIIMPEKNGYEVCEFVKSHPDYKTIPVVLLTGTFEPFDPDRAERAGCDAVVTKPFESQSLIHKVEELIAAAAPAKPPVPEASPFDETAVGGRHSREMMFAPPPAEEPTSDLSDSGSSPADESPADTPSESPMAEPFGETGQPAPDEIFGLSSDTSSSAARDPFDETGPPFPPSSPEPSWPPSAASEPSPQESSESPLSGDAFDLPSPSLPETGFGDVSEGDEESAPAEPAFAPPEPPSGEQVWSAATTAFPKMSFDDLRKAAEENQTSAPPPEPEAHAWPGEETPTPKTSFDDLPAAEQSQEAIPRPEAEESGWPGETAAPQPEAEGSAWSAETTAIPKMSFADLQKSQEPEPEAEPPAEAASLPWETSSAPEPSDEAPEWPTSAAPSDEPAGEQPPASGDFGFDSPTPAEEPAPSEPSPAAEEEGEAWPAASIEEETPVADDSSFATPVATGFEREAAEQEPEVAAAAASGGSLSEADVDRIARRVVELLSDSAVREIAWEVIPDVANAIVRDRIRELEAAD